MLALATLVVGFILGYIFTRYVASAGVDSLNAELNKKVAEARGREDESKNRAAELDAKLAGLNTELKAALEEKGRLQAEATKAETELKNEREKLVFLEEAKTALSNQFQALSADILDQKTKSFSEGSQKELKTLIDPLRDQIKDFRSKVEEAQRESLVGRTQLAGELLQLKNLNERLSSEAHSLSKALRQDTQKQGHWGEQILLQILENSGLRKGEHYTYQESHTAETDEGQPRKRQTDVIVKLPEGRRLIIDSKVTLGAYQDYNDAVDDASRDESLKRLLRSFREHYKGLSERNYERIPGIQSPDFVVLFAPLEPAFLLAIREDPSLWSDAYQKGILLAGPTTILFVVRIVENLWRQEKHSKNVLKIIDRGERLYDKFVDFVADLEKVAGKISEASQSCHDALGKLSKEPRNLVWQVEKLRELGLKPKKQMKHKLLEAAGLDEPALALAAEAAEEISDVAS